MLIHIRLLIRPITSIHWQEIEYGSLGEWVGGIGTVCAFIGAFVIRTLDIRRQERQQREDKIDIWRAAAIRASVRAREAKALCSTRFLGAIREGSRLHQENAALYMPRVATANEAIAQLDIAAADAPSFVLSTLLGDIARNLGALAAAMNQSITAGTLSRGHESRTTDRADYEEQYQLTMNRALEAERAITEQFSELDSWVSGPLR